MTMPFCARCASTSQVAIYDVDKERVPLCPACAPQSDNGMVVRAEDVPSLIASADSISDSVCWCHLPAMGLRVVWCPAHGLTEPPQAQWQPYRKPQE